MIYLCFKFNGEFFFYLFNSFPDILSRYANRSARFISAYGEGLSGAEAAWANKKYHGHRTLPPDMVAEIKKSVL